MNHLRKLVILALATVGSLYAASPFSAHLRATYLQTIDESGAFSALGLNFAENSIKISDKWIPEIDLNYAFTETLTAQLVLTIPQSHNVDLAGVGRLGSFKHLPPTLFLQYSPFPQERLRPYFGAGLNYTLIFDDELSVAGVPLSLENASVGVAAQAGLTYTIDQTWSLNLDIKRAVLRSDVLAGAAKLTQARLDPWLFSFGAQYSF